MKRPFTFKRAHFLLAFVFIVIALGITKCINPDLTLPRLFSDNPPKQTVQESLDSIQLQTLKVDSIFLKKRNQPTLLKSDGTSVKNRVIGIADYDSTFHDLNDVQLATASSIGIPQIENREEAHKHMKELVYIGDNPYYIVAELTQSIPYLVPRAATLLNEIGRTFNDSLATKGYPPCKLIVTSVTRTKEDVRRLRKINVNATENSCHQYGTTFDITYNHFLEVKSNGSGTMKWDEAYKEILAEVLKDMREKGTCYVRFEVKQPCFHITAR